MAIPSSVPGGPPTPDGAKIYLARIERAGWLIPGGSRPADDARRAVREHFRRLRAALDGRIPDAWDPDRPSPGTRTDRGRDDIVFRRATPMQAARIAARCDPAWRRALTLTVARALAGIEMAAGGSGRRRDAAEEAAAVWHAVRRAVAGEVWLAGLRLWAAGDDGPARHAPGGGHRRWRRQTAMPIHPDALVPARVAARMAGTHAAADAVWQTAAWWPNSPWEPVVRLWRMGYWPAGPDRDGRFVILNVAAEDGIRDK